MTVEIRGNDRASICDEYVNPRALAVPGCTAPNRGAGVSAEAELGFRMSPRLRLAAVYAHDATSFDQTVSSTNATGADFDKIGNELAIGEETLGSVTSHDLQVLVYLDWHNATRWAPFAGIGLAASRTRKDFSWFWAGLDQPNAEEIGRNPAGTVSVGRRTLRDTAVGYVLVAAIERQLSEGVSVGLKAR